MVKQWLMDYIDNAFRGVTLGTGIDIYAGESLDQYGNPEENALSERAERNDWRQVPTEHLLDRTFAFCYLDAQAFRFYLPALMIAVLEGNDELLESILLYLRSASSSGTVSGTTYCTLLNRSQRSAVLRFIKYLIYNRAGFRYDEELQRILTGLRRLEMSDAQHDG